MAMQGFNIGIGMLIQINGKDYYLRVVESSAVLGLSWGSSFSTWGVFVGKYESPRAGQDSTELHIPLKQQFHEIEPLFIAAQKASPYGWSGAE